MLNVASVASLIWSSSVSHTIRPEHVAESNRINCYCLTGFVTILLLTSTKYNRINCYTLNGFKASIFLTSKTRFDCLLKMSVALRIRHAMRTRLIILSSMAFVTVPYFSNIISQKARFSEKIFEHITCVLIFSTNFLRHFSFEEELSEI